MLHTVTDIFSFAFRLMMN